MKKTLIAGAAACLLLGLANAQAADMSQDGMSKSGTEMKSGATMKKGSMMHKGAMMHKSKDSMMHKGMQGGAMDKGAMQK